MGIKQLLAHIRSLRKDNLPFRLLTKQFITRIVSHLKSPHDVIYLERVEKSEYAVTPFKLNEMPKINEISHFAHIDYQAFAINDCAACF